MSFCASTIDLSQVENDRVMLTTGLQNKLSVRMRSELQAGR